MAALKPCPFCGSEAVEYQDYRHSVNCNSCGAFGPDHDGLTPEIKMENCIEAWNERAEIKEAEHQKVNYEICPKCGGSGRVYMCAEDGDGIKCHRCNGSGKLS